MYCNVSKFIMITHTIPEKFKNLKISTHLCLNFNKDWQLFFTISSLQKYPDAKLQIVILRILNTAKKFNFYCFILLQPGSAKLRIRIHQKFWALQHCLHCIN